MSRRPEKRKTERVQPFVVRCVIVDGPRRLPGYLTDLSPVGAQVSTEGEAPAAGASVVVEVRLGKGGGATLQRLPARVQWARGEKPPPSFGVTFEITHEERSAIEAVLADIRRRASQI